MHPMFRPTYIDSMDPARRVPALEQALATAREHEEKLLATKRDLEVKQSTFDPRVPTVGSRTRERDLKEALAQVEAGVGPNDGLIEEVTWLLGRPGLAETQRVIALYTEDLKVWKRRRDTDPKDTKPYRLKVGRSHWVDGRKALEGEVVHLTLSAFEAIGDKFEPVVEETPVTS